MLERATPMFGVAAIDDSDLAKTNIEAPPEVARPVEPPAKPVEGPDSTMKIRTSPPERGSPPSQASLVLVGIGGVGMAIAAIFVFFKMRDGGGMRPDGAPKLDVPFYLLPDAAVDADASETPDAPVDTTVAATFDAAGAPIDAATKNRDAAEPRDAGGKPKPDAAVASIDAAVAAAGTATLQIGADPWGDIVVDGTSHGRAPPLVTIQVNAGKHTVEVIYGGEDPPRTKTFQIDVGPGETKKQIADFTKP